MESNESQFFKEMARSDLLSFCVFSDKFYEIAPHHELIREALEKLVRGDIQNLMIEMPPRSGKSRLMEEFIAKLFGDMPNTDVLYTGHSLNLLEGFSRHIRDRIKSDEYRSIYPTRIASDSSAVKNWNVEGGGEFAIYGVGGWITGKGGNILIIDDPYASRQDAESATIRRTVSDWYWSTFLSRKQDDKAKQIIIMQRWREDDLIGEILEREGEKWHELKIPALNEKDESFWPTRFSSEYFIDLKTKNPIFFSSQYQQDPVNEKGGDFVRDYFTYCERIDAETKLERMDVVTFLDPAISERQEADSTGIVTIGIDSHSNNVYLLEVKKLKCLPDQIIDELFDTVARFQNACRSYKAGIETVQYQKMLALEIRKQMTIRDRFFFMEEVKPQGEKNARIRTILQPRYASRTVIHPKDAPNVAELELELLKFPNGKHDDLIDAMASALALSAPNSPVSRTKMYVPDYGGI